MAQFDVYRNDNPQSREAFPYQIDLQSSLLAALLTRIVVPLEPFAADPPMRRLNPVFVVEGRRVVMVTSELTSVRRETLRECVASLSHDRHDIINAIDVLWSGI